MAAVSIMLKELALTYDVHPVHILKNEQSRRPYQKRISLERSRWLVDPPGPSGRPVNLAESGAILFIW